MWRGYFQTHELYSICVCTFVFVRRIIMVRLPFLKLDQVNFCVFILDIHLVRILYIVHAQYRYQAHFDFGHHVKY